MSWHYVNWPCSLGQEEASWEAGSSDGPPDALLRLIPTAAPCSSHDSETEPCPHSPYGTTVRPSMDDHGEDRSTSCLEDSLVRTFPSTEKAQGCLGTDLDLDGKTSPVSSEKLDPRTPSLRTAVTSGPKVLTKCSKTLPTWGMMRDGVLSVVPTLAPHIDAIECGSWATPTVATAQRLHWGFSQTGRRRYGAEIEKNMRHDFSTYGKPTPEPFEWLMGWPIGWTDLNPLATDKFQAWLRLHGRS